MCAFVDGGGKRERRGRDTYRSCDEIKLNAYLYNASLSVQPSGTKANCADLENFTIAEKDRDALEFPGLSHIPACFLRSTRYPISLWR